MDQQFIGVVLPTTAEEMNSSSTMKRTEASSLIANMAIQVLCGRVFGIFSITCLSSTKRGDFCEICFDNAPHYDATVSGIGRLQPVYFSNKLVC